MVFSGPVYSIMEKAALERTALLLWKQYHEDVSVGYLLYVSSSAVKCHCLASDRGSVHVSCALIGYTNLISK